jgi:hypothetical protein
LGRWCSELRDRRLGDSSLRDGRTGCACAKEKASATPLKMTLVCLGDAGAFFHVIGPWSIIRPSVGVWLSRDGPALANCAQERGTLKCKRGSKPRVHYAVLDRWWLTLSASIF